MPTRLLAFALLLATGACGSATPSTTSAPPTTSFDVWSEAFSQEWLRDAPQSATRVQYFTGAEQDTLDRQLALIGEWGNTYGAAAASRRASLARRGREELQRYPAATMTPQQRTSAALLQWSLDDTIASAEFATYSYVFDQFNGLQLDLVNHLTQTHPVRQRRDIENYLARLDARRAARRRGHRGGADRCRRRHPAAAVHPGAHDPANRRVPEGGASATTCSCRRSSRASARWRTRSRRQIAPRSSPPPRRRSRRPSSLPTAASATSSPSNFPRRPMTPACGACRAAMRSTRERSRHLRQPA